MENLSKTYLMVDRITNYIKIGKSKDVFYREKTLQAEKPTIEGLFYVEEDIEKLLHFLFAEKRLRGEWFNLNQEDIDFIDQILAKKILTKKEFSLNDVIRPKKSSYYTMPEKSQPDIIIDLQHNTDIVILSHPLSAPKKLDSGENFIKKSNNLVESKYKFDIWETRFFLSVLSQIRREDADFQVYRIWYKDIIKTFGLKSGDSYSFLREAARLLMSKSVQINYEENGVKRTKELHLINKIDYLTEGQKGIKNISNHEYIDVTVEQEMRPFLLQLSKNFTAYDLRNVTKLSVYSIRLYELLKQYETIGLRTLSIDEMKSMFQVEEQYKLYSDFYRWIIKPSEVEINKHTDLLILDIEKLKEGRKIVSLRFRFRAKTEQELAKIRGNPFQNALLSGLPEPGKIALIQEIQGQVVVVNEQNQGSKEKTKDLFTELIPEVVVDIETSENTVQEKLIVELSPIVVTQFGVSFKMFTTLVEQYMEDEIRQAVQVTQKAIQTGKIENMAGFFVGAVRNHYQDAEQQKKKVEADKIAERKAKAETAKSVEEEAKKQKEQAVRNESNRKVNIIKDLIQHDTLLVHQAVEELSRGLFRKSYDPTKTLDENLENAMFAGGLMNVLQKIEPTIFQ